MNKFVLLVPLLYILIAQPAAAEKPNKKNLDKITNNRSINRDLAKVSMNKVWNSS